MKPRILSFGGGVDSSAILAEQLFGIRDHRIDAVVFADTGAESAATYVHVERARAACESAGLPFHVVANAKETITQWVMRLGIVPVMPGGSHICSRKFKGEVIDRFTQSTWGPVTFLIGIEANEGYRSKRFTPPAGDDNSYEYPLIDNKMDRAACVALLESVGWSHVQKSSCVFCPFMSEAELADLSANDWDLIHAVERNFERTSREKHQAWLDAGQPLNRGGRAPRGMWRKDSWAEGARLFARKVNGERLTTRQWRDRVIASD